MRKGAPRGGTLGNSLPTEPSPATAARAAAQGAPYTRIRTWRERRVAEFICAIAFGGVPKLHIDPRDPKPVEADWVSKVEAAVGLRRVLIAAVSPNSPVTTRSCPHSRDDRNAADSRDRLQAEAYCARECHFTTKLLPTETAAPANAGM